MLITNAQKEFFFSIRYTCRYITQTSGRFYASPGILPIWGEAPTEVIYLRNYVVGDVFDVITYAKFQSEIFGITILQGFNFFIFLLFFCRATQLC